MQKHFCWNEGLGHAQMNEMDYFCMFWHGKFLPEWNARIAICNNLIKKKKIKKITATLKF
jgi:hypothetical protein